MEDKRSKFLKIFTNIPEKLREEVVVIIEGKPYSWSTAYIEIRNNTALGKKILKTMDELEIL